jgi:hypothetical protein
MTATKERVAMSGLAVMVFPGYLSRSAFRNKDW